MNNKTIFLVGDLHLRLDNLEVAAKVFDQIYILADEREPSGIYFMGDVYDIKGIIRVEVQNFLYQQLNRLSKITHCFILVGNHDMVGTVITEHAFKFLNSMPVELSRNITLIDKSCFHFHEDANIIVAAHPYIKSGSEFTSNVEKILDDIDKLTSVKMVSSDSSPIPKILLTHQDYRGFYYRNGMPIEGDNIVDPYTIDTRISRVFNGHLHSTSSVGIVHNIGIPFTHNFGECDYWTGITEIENRHGQICMVLHSLDKVPEHVHCKLHIIDRQLIMDPTVKIPRSYDFVKISVSGPKHECLDLASKEKVIEMFRQKSGVNLQNVTIKYDFTDKEIIKDDTFNESVTVSHMLNKFIELNVTGEIADLAKVLGAKILNQHAN